MSKSQLFGVMCQEEIHKVTDFFEAPYQFPIYTLYLKNYD
jgi:hypothetical protein